MAAPLLTRQEERVLTLWMDGASNQKIASNLRINGKTVYTYKRNIRMKLHMDTRYSPFYRYRKWKIDGTVKLAAVPSLSLVLSFSCCARNRVTTVGDIFPYATGGVTCSQYRRKHQNRKDRCNCFLNHNIFLL